MNLQPRTDSITVQKEILKTTQGQVFKVGGLTLDSTAFAAGVVPAGTPVSVPIAGGKAISWTDLATDVIPYVTTHDVSVKTGSDALVGGYEEAYLDKTKVTLTPAFITAAGSRYKLR
ncbi:hypothetical protein [Planococcus faecalis]|uniref:Head decoration protein n=1 Tax=Planococcus faecalis TaxID=1598147 RepID=A0ABN4XLW2_9BACL|nr:hypothetical protein [Planococcus faecalis]AQU79725.1 hypothetical protein AJGP001_10820 [Planococcus faecalis]OHX52078.1 hypothetical protein BB777_14195 [Planococcus faecalis]